jgi:small conductance mechanosensitive channel
MKRVKTRWPRLRRTRQKLWQIGTQLVVRSLLLFLVIAGIGYVGQNTSAAAQLPIPAEFSEPLPSILKPSISQDGLESGWVRLDGRAVFRVATPDGKLNDRMQEIQRNLAAVRREYVNSDEPALNIEVRGEEDLPTIYINDRYVMTVTHLDAQIAVATTSRYAERLKNTIAQALRESLQERQPAAMIRQTQRAILLVLVTGALSLGLSFWQQHWRRSQREPTDSNPGVSPITSRITQQHRKDVRAIRAFLFQVGQICIWITGILLTVGLFPQTRWIQSWFIQTLPYRLSVIIIIAAVYLGIRLSFVVIDWFIGTLIDGGLLIPNRNQRAQQRVSTISRVLKGVTVLLLILIGILAGLINLGVDIAPLIAGAGLVGVAISLASQNLIRDAINGFLILLEDQYAVGDVIVVGDVFGLVENMTLRITQLRDPEERLITIPNSEIKIVSNLSSRHSQADIKIPVAYSADIDQALALVQQVGAAMMDDTDWANRMLAKPLNLGLDEFNDRGMVIRVWIRTQPLEQWNVAREYRRRIKVAFDQNGIPLMLSQQELWVHSNGTNGVSNGAIAPPHQSGSPSPVLHSIHANGTEPMQ